MSTISTANRLNPRIRLKSRFGSRELVRCTSCRNQMFTYRIHRPEGSSDYIDFRERSVGIPEVGFTVRKGRMNLEPCRRSSLCRRVRGGVFLGGLSAGRLPAAMRFRRLRGVLEVRPSELFDLEMVEQHRSPALQEIDRDDQTLLAAAFYDDAFGSCHGTAADADGRAWLELCFR